MVKTQQKRRMWNIELDRHRDIMRAESEDEVLRQKQEFEARYPKKQAGIIQAESQSLNLINRWIRNNV